MIKIICVGKIKESYLREAISDYEKRISKYHRLDLIYVPDSNMRDEAKKIFQYIKSDDYVITMDICGTELSSVEFANMIDKLFITNSSIVFVIGGSDGIDVSVKERSNYALSFSKFTFPHQLFRVLLLEQIYRSFKIMNNETYHK